MSSLDPIARARMLDVLLGFLVDGDAVGISELAENYRAIITKRTMGRIEIA